MPRKTLYLLLAALLLFAGARLYYNLTDDFKLSNISDSLPYNPAWEVPYTEELRSTLEEAVAQPYHYIGKGAQVYAFASEDGKYVLKFFKFKHLRPSLFISSLPPLGPLKEFKAQNVARKERKLQGVFEGHRIAYNHDKENSGLIYIHLNLSDTLHLKAQLIDKIGRKHIVDLDKTVFVLQKKGETLRTVLDNLMKQKDVKTAALRANQILSMYREEYSHQVYDRDHGISHNTGFIGDQPFHLDVGKFSYDPKMSDPAVHAADLEHVAYKIREWVRLNHPEQTAEFEVLFNPQ